MHLLRIQRNKNKTNGITVECGDFVRLCERIKEQISLEKG